MTKMKSKKMSKSTFAVIIMAIVMVAMLAFGGTYAYFTAHSKAIAGGSVTTATVVLNGNEATVSNTTSRNVVPGQTAFETDATVTAKHSSTTATYVFVKMTTNNNMYVEVDGEDEEVFELTTTSAGTDGTDGWTALTGVDGVYYMAVDAVETETALTAFAYNVAFNSAVQAKKVEGDNGTITEQNNVYTIGDGDVHTPVATIEGVTITITLNFYAIQQDGMNDASDAWTKLNNQTIA